MSTRRVTNHQACLESFSLQLRRDIKENLKAWTTMDPIQARTRRAAYAHVVVLLKQAAAETDIPLADLGLAGYEVPDIETT